MCEQQARHGVEPKSTPWHLFGRVDYSVSCWHFGPEQAAVSRGICVNHEGWPVVLEQSYGSICLRCNREGRTSTLQSTGGGCGLIDINTTIFIWLFVLVSHHWTGFGKMKRWRGKRGTNQGHGNWDIYKWLERLFTRVSYYTSNDSG